MRKLIAMVLLLGWVTLAMEQNVSTPRDSVYSSGVTGGVWLKMPFDFKATYVAGFNDASEIHWLILRELAKRYPQIGSDVEQLKKSNPPFGNSPTEQIIKGLDSFYSDYRNENIHVAGGMRIVAMELSGQPASVIEAATLDLRRLSQH